jgi:hypothetical protein
MMRLGQNPTEAELKDLLNGVDIEGNGSINFEGFVQIINLQKSEHQPFFSIDDELKEAFNVFDKSIHTLPYLIIFFLLQKFNSFFIFFLNKQIMMDTLMLMD